MMATMIMRPRASTVVSAALLAACGQEGGPTGSSIHVRHDESGGATHALPADPPAAVRARVTAMADPVVGVAALPGGAALVGTAGGSMRLDPPPGGVSSLRVEAVDADPPQTGAVRGFASRWESSEFVLAERGLFYTSGDHLLYSPVSAGLDGAPVAVAAAAPGDLFVATAGGLYRARGGAFASLAVPGQTGGPAHLARGSAATADITFASYDGGLVAIEAQGEDLFAVKLETIAPGRVHALAAAPDGTLVVGSDSGVLVRSPAGAWSRYTMAAAGADSVAALRVAATADADGGLVAYALHAGGLWRLGGGVQSTYTVVDTDPATVLSLGADRAGRVYLGRKGDVLQVLTETVPEGKATFSDHIVPFTDTYCSVCHGQTGYAPIRLWKYQDFKTHIDRTIAALTSGKMPLGGKLAPGDWAIVTRWKEDGMLP